MECIVCLTVLLRRVYKKEKNPEKYLRLEFLLKDFHFLFKGSVIFKSCFY